MAAEQAVFEQASVITDLGEIGRLWETPAGQAARIADVQAIAIYQAAEAAINSTQDRQQFLGMPWVPTELQEVVSVAFGCTAEDRWPSPASPGRSCSAGQVLEMDWVGRGKEQVLPVMTQPEVGSGLQPHVLFEHIEMSAPRPTRWPVQQDFSRRG